MRKLLLLLFITASTVLGGEIHSKLPAHLFTPYDKEPTLENLEPEMAYLRFALSGHLYTREQNEAVVEMLAKITVDLLSEARRIRFGAPPLSLLDRGAYRTAEIQPVEHTIDPDALRKVIHKLDRLYAFGTFLVSGEFNRRHLKKILSRTGVLAAGTGVAGYEAYVHLATGGIWPFVTVLGVGFTGFVIQKVINQRTDEKIREPIRLRDHYWQALETYGLKDVPKTMEEREHYLAKKIKEAVGIDPKGYDCSKALRGPASDGPRPAPKRLEDLADETALLLAQEEAEYDAALAYRTADLEVRIAEKIDEAANIALEEAKKPTPVADLASQRKFQTNLMEISLLQLGIPMIVAIGNFGLFLNLIELVIVNHDLRAAAIFAGFMSVPYIGVANFIYLHWNRTKNNPTIYDKIRVKLKSLRAEHDGGFKEFFMERVLRQSSPKIRVAIQKRIADECGEKLSPGQNSKAPGEHKGSPGRQGF